MPRKRTAKRKKTNSSKKSKSSTKKLKSKRKRVKKIKTLGRPLSLSLIEVKERPKLSPLVIDVVVDKPCPVCKTPLSDTILCNTEVDFCPHCFGLWFEEEELRWAKDEKDKNLNWLDFDIWKDEKKFKIAYGIRLCPTCRVPLYEVYYGDPKDPFSKERIVVDVCNLCHGIWLDRGEFKKIIEYLKKKGDYEILHNYTKNLLKELGEVFWGPETLREEISDVLTVLKLFRYKFASQHPFLAKMISQWISSSPK